MSLSEDLRKMADALDSLKPISDCILLWHPSNCPDWAWKCFSNHDDIDWIGFVPKGYQVPDFMEYYCREYGPCRTEDYPAPGGTLHVGYHA